MEMATKLKNNLERFFYEKSVDYGIDPEFMLSRLQKIDYQNPTLENSMQDSPVLDRSTLLSKEEINIEKINTDQSNTDLRISAFPGVGMF